MQTALITGGSGFIGRALRRNLAAKGFNTISFDPNPAPAGICHRRGSILDLTDVQSAVNGVDVVFHLALE